MSAFSNNSWLNFIKLVAIVQFYIIVRYPMQEVHNAPGLELDLFLAFKPHNGFLYYVYWFSYDSVFPLAIVPLFISLVMLTITDDLKQYPLRLVVICYGYLMYILDFLVLNYIRQYGGYILDFSIHYTPEYFLTQILSVIVTLYLMIQIIIKLYPYSAHIRNFKIQLYGLPIFNSITEKFIQLHIIQRILFELFGLVVPYYIVVQLKFLLLTIFVVFLVKNYTQIKIYMSIPKYYVFMVTILFISFTMLNNFFLPIMQDTLVNFIMRGSIMGLAMIFLVASFTNKKIEKV